MMQGNDDILKNKIASLDNYGQPLHRQLLKISDLTSALFDLAARSRPLPALKHRPKGATGFVAIPIFPNGGNDFQVMPAVFTRDEAPQGVEIIYEYYAPGTGGKVAAQGELDWVN